MHYDQPSIARPGPTMANGLKGHTSPGAVRVTIPLVNVAVALTDNAGVVAYGSLKLCTLPVGLVTFLGASADLAISKSSAGVNADADGDISLGTVAANSGATLATTEQDLCPTTEIPQMVAGVTTGDLKSTATEVGTVHDGTSTAKSVYLNFLIDDTDHDVTGTACSLIFNGSITLVYAMLGDV